MLISDECTQHKGFVKMRVSGLCLTTVKKDDGTRYTRNETAEACNNLSCDGLNVRMAVLNNQDKMADAGFLLDYRKNTSSDEIRE
jgi:hypothetical protein